MASLKGLSASARAALGDDFRRGEISNVDVTSHICDVAFDRPISIDPLRELIEITKTKFGNSIPSSDAWLGPRVHAAFRLTRREAADRRLWQHLTVVDFPDYVHWRWGDVENEKAVSHDRFFGEDSKNSLARLWWAAELTRNGPDYCRSETALGISRFFVSWMEIKVSHHRPCTLAVVDFLNSLQSVDTQGQTMAKAVNALLRTVSLDLLVPNPPTDAEAIRAWLTGKVDVTRMVNELPIGPDEAPIPDEDIATIRKFLDNLAAQIDLVGTKRIRSTRSINRVENNTLLEPTK